MTATPRALLHVYPQHTSHDEAYVVGTRKGLMQLWQALNHALFTKDGRAKAEVEVKDGEGYDLHVAVLEDEQGMDRLAFPYTHDMFEHANAKLDGPHKLVQEAEAKETTS